MNGWPSKSILSQVRILQIYVVPVGNHESGQYSLESRLSFISIERELVWSFNETQFHCFFILKYITKCNFVPLAPEELSTYHLKQLFLAIRRKSNGMETIKFNQSSVIES
jgi:hypothetical protein